MKHLFGSLAAALALSITTSASAKVMQVSDQGFLIVVSALVPANADDSWKALTAPSGWWSKDHTFSGDPANLYIDSQATGCFCELLPLPKNAAEGQRRGSVQHMRILYSSPGKVLRLSGGLGPLQSEAVNGTWTILMKPEKDGTRILWEYVVGGYMRYKADQIAPVIDAVLSEQLASLALKLGATPPEPDDEKKGAPKKDAPKKDGAEPERGDDAEAMEREEKPADEPKPEPEKAEPTR